MPQLGLREILCLEDAENNVALLLNHVPLPEILWWHCKLG